MAVGQHAEIGSGIRLYVPPIYNRPLRGDKPALPIILEPFGTPIAVTEVTAHGPRSSAGSWIGDRPIASLVLKGRRTIEWVPPVLPELPSYSTLIKAAGAEAFCWIVGAPLGTEAEKAGTFAGFDAWAPRRFAQFAFAVKAPADRTVNSSVKQVVGTAMQIASGQPLLFRLWSRADRTGGVALSYQFVLDVEFHGDLTLDKLARGVEHALSLVGVEARTSVLNSGGRE